MASVKSMLKARYGSCPVPGCEEPATAKHHILYQSDHGQDVIEMLCKEHHEWITRSQSHAARRQHHPLSIKQRWRFWYELKNGRMKRPRTSYLDREYSETRQYPPS